MKKHSKNQATNVNTSKITASEIKQMSRTCHWH